MITATSILECEYLLEFPVIIREKMNIRRGDHFYAYRHGPPLVLSRIRPGKSKYCNSVEFHSEREAVLPHGFLSRMRIRPGDELELSVEEGKILIRKSEATPLFSSVTLKAKLKREFEVPTRVISHSFREDVYHVLLLTKWPDDVVPRLVQTPNLLQEVALALHNDDVFSEFFEQRTKELTLELARSGVPIR